MLLQIKDSAIAGLEEVNRQQMFQVNYEDSLNAVKEHKMEKKELIEGFERNGSALWDNLKRKRV